MMSVLDTVRAALPDLPEGSKVYVDGVELEAVKGGMVDAHVTVSVLLPTRVDAVFMDLKVR